MDMILEQFKTIFDRPEKVKKLREVILDLAVQGKLVNQNPNDDPASILLKKIKEEKATLIKEKKIKKEKPLSEISKEEEPFELPSTWEFARLGELGNIFNGNSINAKIKQTVYAKVEEGYNYISTKDVNFNGKYIDFNTGIKIPYDEKKFKIAHSGSVLICAEGGSAGKKIGLIDRDICFGNKLYAIEPFKGILSEYIFYVFQSTMFLNLFTSKMTGIIGGISISNFKEIIIPLCSIDEQRLIVEKVNSLMELCDELEKVLEDKVKYSLLSAKSVFNSVSNIKSTDELEEALRFILANFKDISLGDNAVKELKNCILQLAVQGKLVDQNPNDEPAEVLLEKIKEEKERLIKANKIKKEKALSEINKEEEPFELPSKWVWVRLNEISMYIQRGKSPKYVELSQFPVISQKCIQWTGFNIEKARFIQEESIEKYTEERFLEIGDLLWNSTGLGTLGRINIYPGNTRYCKVVADSHVTVIRPVKRYINYNYLLNWFSGPIVQGEIEGKSSGSTKQMELSTSTIKQYIVPLPPLEEQNRIVEKVDSLMKLCDELEKKIQEQKEYSNKLMESIIKSSLS